MRKITLELLQEMGAERTLTFQGRSCRLSLPSAFLSHKLHDGLRVRVIPGLFQKKPLLVVDLRGVLAEDMGAVEG